MINKDKYQKLITTFYTMLDKPSDHVGSNSEQYSSDLDGIINRRAYDHSALFPKEISLSEEIIAIRKSIALMSHQMNQLVITMNEISASREGEDSMSKELTDKINDMNASVRVMDQRINGVEKSLTDIKDLLKKMDEKLDTKPSKDLMEKTIDSKVKGSTLALVFWIIGTSLVVTTVSSTILFNLIRTVQSIVPTGP